MNLNVALVHFPVLNKHNNIVTTSVTLFDIHDIARSCATFGVHSFYIVNHAEKQHQVVQRVVNFWADGYGKEYNENRKEALDHVTTVSFWEDAKKDIENREGKKVVTIGTSARKFPHAIQYPTIQNDFKDQPVLLLFGTGWGLANSITDKVDYMLEPIYGPTPYNHLSVRSAVAIILYNLTAQGN